MAKLAFLQFLLILSSYTLFQTTHGQDKNKTSFTLTMVPFNSPEHPSYKHNRTREEIMTELVHISNVRVNGLQRLTVLNSSRIPTNERPIRPVIKGINSRGIYLVKIGIGTFENEPYFHKSSLLLDLGSDHTWTQCQGCSPCFHQEGPYFPWRQSQTYRLAPCSKCPEGFCQREHCYYNQDYGVGGHIRGYVSRDTFTVATEGIVPLRIQDVEFVCVFSTLGYKGEIGGPDDIESGVFSLSRKGYTNFMRTVIRPDANDGRFSYCLPPLDSPITRLLYIRFGEDIPPPPIWAQTTRLQEVLHDPLYYLQLVGLSVDATRLRIDPQVFAMNRNGVGGCIIDPSVPLAHLTRPAYDLLVDVLAHQFEAKNRGFIIRVHPSPIPDFSLCYKKRQAGTPRQVRILYHFKGNASLEVENPMNLFIQGNVRYHCLQIQPTPAGAATVIGAIHQVNHRFVYDVTRSRLHFWYTDCSHNN